jgi:DNA-binding MarR family transcriptional regulator
MASLRGVKRQAAQLHELFIELGRWRSMRDPLSGLDVGDLTPPQVHAIMWLGCEGQLSASILAQRIGSSMPASTGIVDRLEKAGFVERDRQEGDRRVVVIRLTESGKKLAGELHAAFEEKLAILLGALDEPDREALVGIIGRLVGKLQARGPRESE